MPTGHDARDVIGRNGLPKLAVVWLLDFYVHHGLPLTNTIFEHKVDHKCAWYQSTFGQMSMTYFLLLSSHLSDDHPLGVSWIRCRGRMIDRPGKLKQVVTLNWNI